MWLVLLKTSHEIVYYMMWNPKKLEVVTKVYCIFVHTSCNYAHLLWCHAPLYFEEYGESRAPRFCEMVQLRPSVFLQLKRKDNYTVYVALVHSHKSVFAFR